MFRLFSVYNGLKNSNIWKEIEDSFDEEKKELDSRKQ